MSRLVALLISINLAGVSGMQLSTKDETPQRPGSVPHGEGGSISHLAARRIDSVVAPARSLLWGAGRLEHLVVDHLASSHQKLYWMLARRLSNGRKQALQSGKDADAVNYFYSCKIETDVAVANMKSPYRHCHRFNEVVGQDRIAAMRPTDSSRRLACFEVFAVTSEFRIQRSTTSGGRYSPQSRVKVFDLHNLRSDSPT